MSIISNYSRFFSLDDMFTFSKYSLKLFLFIAGYISCCESLLLRNFSKVNMSGLLVSIKGITREEYNASQSEVKISPSKPPTFWRILDCNVRVWILDPKKAVGATLNAKGKRYQTNHVEMTYVFVVSVNFDFPYIFRAHYTWLPLDFI